MINFDLFKTLHQTLNGRAETLNELGFSECLISQLNSATASQSGLIICNGKQPESKLTLEGLYPNWQHLSIDEFKNNFNVEGAFVYLNDHDPIALVTSLLEGFSSQEARRSIAKRIKTVLSLIPVKRQCGTCAKPTPIPLSSRNQFPPFLLEEIPTSYLFSRGCERCEYRSYKGFTFLESFFSNEDNFLEGLCIDLSPDIIFKKSREIGFNIFHESGLAKIKSGLTSLEQILEHIPPIEQAFAELLNSNPKVEKNNTIQSPSTGRSILIVEDDTDQREILKLVFSKEGFNVFTAENGKNALEVLKSHSVEIILSDIMMPVMNGLQLVKNIKNSEFKNIPVLMLTASSNPDHEVTLLEAGADDYCAKNVKKKVLLTRVEKLLEKNKPSGTALDHLLN